MTVPQANGRPRPYVADAGAAARDNPRMPRRFPAATAAQPTPMAALGDGALDIRAIVRAAAHAEWLVVELDEVAGDMDTAIERSFGYLSQL